MNIAMPMKRYYLTTMIEDSSPVFPVMEHDHALCVDEAIARARAAFSNNDVKWTDLRELVFREIVSSHKPVSAYELLERLSARGRRLAPVSVYRILDVLQKAGLVHRLESRNAFYACMTGHTEDESLIVLICNDCGRVAEQGARDAIEAIHKATEAKNFRLRSTVLEVSGICGECHATASG